MGGFRGRGIFGVGGIWMLSAGIVVRVLSSIRPFL